MLKTAAAKLAHNSTIPALAGNKALRPLQDLITSEKAIITSLVQLSLRFSRASEALRIWGQGEGEDLSDVLTASNKLLLEFSAALTKFADHEQSIREHMKEIRTQEEVLEALRTRRRGVVSKADSAERKLSKMDPGHKDMPTQTALLERLRDTIRGFDSEIMTGEANLGDLKRTTTMTWMALKFGGLEECCRKGLIVAEVGKLIMVELPQEPTEPGLARPFYAGNARTVAHVADALRALQEVSMDSPTSSDRMQFSPDVNRQGGHLTATSALPEDEYAANVGARFPGNGNESLQYRGRYVSDAPRPSFERSDLARPPADEHGAFLPQSDLYRFHSLNTRQRTSPPNLSIRSRDGPQQNGPPASSGGRFATFPVKGKREDPVVSAEPPAGSMPSSDVERVPPEGNSDDVAPMYHAFEGHRTPPPGPPRGAAPPAIPHANIYGGYDPDSEPSFVPSNISDKEDDTQLPYMGSPERKVPLGSRPLPMPRPRAHFDLDAESVEEPNEPAPPSTELDPFRDEQDPLASNQGESISRDRTPTLPSIEDTDDEQALNAAAAREVSREMDSLMYQPPTVMPRDPSPEPSSPPPLSIPPITNSAPRSSSDSVTHQSSPITSGRGRGSGSPIAPPPRNSVEHPPPTNVPSSPRVASAPSSSPTQQARLPPPTMSVVRSPSPSLSGLNSPPLRSPPEIPPSPTSASPQRSLPQSTAKPLPPGKTPPFPRQGAGMISVAAFRRPAPRTGSEPVPSAQDVSPLSIRKKDLRTASYVPQMGGTPNSKSPLQSPELGASLSHVQHQDDEFDYISAYYSSGGDDIASPPSLDQSRSFSNGLR
ncbi:Eisosome component PIL1-domain-containing protein [Russula earlei]|uniref:Eisosome component PIL1-domain-containing protein n=1 Tax=Russula earlei TaxID=71964 RepID=A0ACC0UK30_9AGAM|nr:Eisosome component PIL1-domain-containing protein [Russula earlei]